MAPSVHQRHRGQHECPGQSVLVRDEPYPSRPELRFCAREIFPAPPLPRGVELRLLPHSYRRFASIRRCAAPTGCCGIHSHGGHHSLCCSPIHEANSVRTSAPDRTHLVSSPLAPCLQHILPCRHSHRGAAAVHSISGVRSPNRIDRSSMQKVENMDHSYTHPDRWDIRRPDSVSSHRLG